MDFRIELKSNSENYRKREREKERERERGRREGREIRELIVDAFW